MKKRNAWFMLLSASMICSNLQSVNISMAAQTKTNQPAFVKKLKKAALNVSQQNKKKPSCKEGEVIAYFQTKDKASKSSVAIGSTSSIKVADVWSFGKENGESRNVVHYVSDSLTTKQLLAKVKKETNAKYVTPNYVYHTNSLTNDSYSGEQWALQNVGQGKGKVGNDIDITKAWEDDRYKKFVADDSKEAPVVATIDTGFDFKNPDLKDVAWTNTHMATLQGKHGYDFCNDDANPQDDHGHGSHVAGIIAASVNNNTGIAGQNKKVKIMPLKALDEMGSGSDDALIGAYNYVYRAKKLGVNIVSVNNSWGGAATENQCLIYKKIIDAVGKEGVVSVFAAGNDGCDIDGYYDPYDEGGKYKVIPASVKSKYAVTVAALDEDGQLASYSNYGKKTVDIAAPGTDILSTVSYPCFNPTIYSDQKKKEVCDFYQGFDGDSFGQSKDLPQYYEQPEVLNTGSYISISKGAKVNVSVGKEQFAGKSSNALHLDMKNMKAGDYYLLAVPYEMKENSDKLHSSSYYSALVKGDAQFDKTKNDYGYVMVAFDAAIEKDGTIDMQTAQYIYDERAITANNRSGFTHFMRERDEKGVEGKKRAIVFAVLVQSDMDAQISIDDIAISKPVTEEKAADAFEKYDYYCGTSMAAPHVTGAVALLSAIYPEKNAEQLRNTVCGLSKTSELIGDKIATGSYLTYEKLDKFQPVINEMKMVNGKLSVTGDYFGNEKGKVFLGDKEMPATDLEWTDSSVSISGVKDINRDITLRLETSNGSTTHTDFVYSAEKECKENTASTMLSHGSNAFYSMDDLINMLFGLTSGNDVAQGGKLCTDGTNLYYVSYGGMIYRYENMVDPVTGNKIKDWNALTTFDANTIFGQDKTPASEFSYDSVQMVTNPVYLNGSIYSIVSNGKSHNRTYQLVAYNTVTNVWSANDIPADKDMDNVIGYALGSYNGKICLVGGYDQLTKKPVNSMYIIDPAAKNPTWEKGANLPEGRYSMQLCQSGDKLYSVLGGKEDGKVPATCVYDGTKWSMVGGDVLEKAIATGSGITWNDEEQVNTYYTADVSTVKNGIIFSGITGNGLGNIFTLKEKADGAYDYQSTDYAWKNIVNTGNDTAVAVGKTYYIMTADEDGMAKLYSMPIEDANVKVVDKSDSKKAVVVGACEYLYGQKAVLSAKATNKNYVVKDFIMNGKKYKADATVTVVLKKDITVKAEVEKKVFVKKLTLNKKNISLAAGKKVTLKAKVTPSNASVKDILWSSSNVKYATVSDKGVVMATKAGKGKTVKITATALDGSKVKAVCVVKIK